MDDYAIKSNRGIHLGNRRSRDMTSPRIINKTVTDPATVQYVRKLAFTMEHPEWVIDWMAETSEYVAVRDNPGELTVSVETGDTMFDLLNRLDEITAS
jgi:hypothetical protein